MREAAQLQRDLRDVEIEKGERGLRVIVKRIQEWLAARYKIMLQLSANLD